MNTLWQDLKFGFRMLMKNPGFTLVAISSLAVGLALTATTLATVNAYLLRSLPYPTAQRVYHVMYAPPGPYEPSGMTEIDWESLADVVADTITSSGQTHYIMNEGSVTATRSLQVSAGFIRGLGVQATVGRTFVEDEFMPGGNRAAMIGHALWRDSFGSDPQITGRQLHVNQGGGDGQSESLTIVGVLPPGFWFGRESTARVDILTPLQTRIRTYMVRLQEGVSVAQAEHRITNAAKNVGSDFRPGWSGVHLESMHQRYVENIQPVLVGIMTAVGIVLVLVCANVAILILLRAMRRQKEMVVRTALGAEGKHILRMLTVEVGLISGAALAASLFLSSTLMSYLMPVIETQLGRPAPAGPSAIQIDFSVFLMLCGVCFLITMSLALIPALTPWRRRLADALCSQGASASDSPFMRRLQTSLIVLEIGGALVMLICCGLMIRSAVNLANTDLGLKPDQVLRVGIRLPAQTYPDAPQLLHFFTELTERLPQLPNSQMTLASAFPPFYPANTERFEVGDTQTEDASVGVMRVGAGYFGLYDVALRRGREFTPADRLGSEPVTVISETLAQKLWQNDSALGRQIRVVEGDMPGSPFGPWRTVIGVVGDIRQGYEDSDLRDVYLPFLQTLGHFASLHVRTDLPLSFWDESVRKAVADVDRYAQVSPAVSIVSEDRQRAGARFLTSMLTGFAIFAVLLAVLGIYGITSYTVQMREREIGIRIALGAQKQSVYLLVIGQGVKLAAAGVGIGVFAAVILTRIMRSMLYEVNPLDPVTFVSVTLLLTASVLLACYIPARRAANVDPMTALRCE